MAKKHVDSKEIIALSTFEAVRLRPTMYIGQVVPMDDKLPLIIDGKLKMAEKYWSPGFMHLVVEILENALDEAKRMKGKMKNIYVTVNLDNNEVIITDEGTGFLNGHKKHQKTRKNIVRTALEDLHAGSNFVDTSTNILGTHGVGSAVTNILSQSFSIHTVNKTHSVSYEWKDFKVVKEEIRKKTAEDNLGTKISFIPSEEIFKNFKWDEELITTYLSYKAFLIKKDPIIKNLKIIGKFIKNGNEYDIPVTTSFIRGPSVKVETPIGIIYVWPNYEGSGSLSFVNGSQCTGIHQKMINDWCNEFFNYPYAHHFYDTLISINVPSHLMRFADQNKTKFATGRWELEEILEPYKGKITRALKGSEIAKEVEQKIEDRLHAENIKKIRKAKRQSKRKISEKYSPPSKMKGSIYITEGLSAAGSVKQARDSENDGVYALKGKVKNVRKLSDLSNNKELLEIMSILDIEPDSEKTCSYDKIIIAADEDPDGQHISSLIINFFHRWFPHIIKERKLFKILTPLVACNYGKDRHYFYSLEDFQEFSKNKKVSNLSYLKGLGSLSLEDWVYVMNNKVLFEIVPDRSAKRYLDIAFGASSQKRKQWLEGK